jgi:hypothetical protein
MLRENTERVSLSTTRKLRSKSRSTATSPEVNHKLNLGKINPLKILKVHVEPSNQKFLLCQLKPRRGRFGWKQGLYWLERNCLVPEVLDTAIIKLEVQKDKQLDAQLGSSMKGFRTILIDGMDQTLRDANFKLLQQPVVDQSSKSLQFEAKELDHLSRLSEGSEEENYQPSGADHTDFVLGSPISEDEHAYFQEAEAIQENHLVNQQPDAEQFLGKRGNSQSQNPSMRAKYGHTVNERKFMKAAMMQEELLDSPMNHTKLKMEFQAAERFDEIYPRIMSDLRHFEVIGVTGVSSFNDDKYYSVMLKHKKEPTMRALRILTAAELSAILGSN